MKRNIIIIFVSVAFAAFLSSCQKENFEDQSGKPKTKVFAFESSIVDDTVPAAAVAEEGRAAVDVITGKVSWENEDQIKVSNGSAEVVFTYDSAKKLFVSDEGLEDTGTFSAIYPASIAGGFSSGSFAVTLPAVQQYYEGLVKQAPMSAYSTTHTLTFKNLCGILNLKMNGDHTISSIVFTANGKGVAGAATVNPATGVLTMDNTEQNTLTLNTESVTLGQATPFYIVVPAQLYSNGFSLVANTTTSGIAFDKSTTKAVPISAGHISAMKAFDAMLFSGGLGTAENPYKIGKEQDLIDLSTYSNGDDYAMFNDKHYKQTQNITMTVASFYPICKTAAKGFTGVFDGADKYIYELNIPLTNDNVGLFGCMNSGTIKDVHLSASNQATITGAANVGGIVGRMASGTISGCGFGKIRVEGSGNNCGVVVGYVAGPGANIDDCSVGASCSVELSSSAIQMGAIAGKICTGCSITNCEVKPCTLTAPRRVGGIVGMLDGDTVVDKCFSSAKIVCNPGGTTVVQSGGIVGYIAQSKVSGEEATIINCIYSQDFNYTGGTITSICNNTNYAYVGGIVGAFASQSGSVGSLKIVNCYSYPYLIKNTGACIKGYGGILGGSNTNKVQIMNCYSPIVLSGFHLNGSEVNISNYSSFDFIGSVVGYPQTTMTLDRVYGRQPLRLANASSGYKPTMTNISTVIGDPTLKNYDNIVYHPSFTRDVVSYPTLKEALDHGVDVYNATDPDVKAIYWTTDTKFDGYLKPDGVYQASTKTYKKVSLFGDSITTYRGYIFEDHNFKYNPYYPNSWTESGSTVYGDVLSERNTWWWKLIYDKMTDARLEVDNAYSGSSVSHIDSNTPNYDKHEISDAACTTYCFVPRFRAKGYGNPDICIIYGGRNDFAKYGEMTDDYLGAYDESRIRTQYQQAYSVGSGFSYRDYTNAMAGLIGLMKRKNNDIKILILCCDRTSDGYEAAANAIASALTKEGVDIKAVSFHVTGTKDQNNPNIPKDHGNSCHPNNTGTTWMANYIYSQVGSWLDE